MGERRDNDESRLSGPVEVVVLVHGGLDRRESMVRLAAACAPLAPEVVRYDRRGYGTRSGHPGPFRVSDHVEDLREVIAGRRAVVFGHSFGGVVALAAAEGDSSIAAVAVYECPLAWMPWWPAPDWSATAADPEAAAEAMVRRIAGDAAWEALPERAKASRRAEGVVLLAELADSRGSAAFDAGSIVVPVRVGHGTKGHEHHRVGTERLAGMLPDATLVVIEGATHVAHRTHSGEVAERLIAPLVVGRR